MPSPPRKRASIAAVTRLLSPLAAFCMCVWFASIGEPHLGQALALSDISLEQSLQVISGINFSLSIKLVVKNIKFPTCV